MKKTIAVLLTLALLLCGLTALAETAETGAVKINTLIDEGGFVIQIDCDGDQGWMADDMAQDDSVVSLYFSDVLEGTFVARYQPTGDGDVTVGVRHYTGIACDRALTWDLHVENGAVQEVTGGSAAETPDGAELDPYLIGLWAEVETQYAVMTVSKNDERSWAVEIVSPLTHGAYVFKTTVYYDCELDSFVYDKGKFWDIPTTDEESEDLGEAKIAGTTGRFDLVGDEESLYLSWHDDEIGGDEVLFEPLAGSFTVDYGASELYTDADMEAAVEQIVTAFEKFEGCELHELRYAGDDCASAENLEWANSLVEGQDFAQVIEFLSDFHSPVEGGGAWEEDTEYTDWQWWLARPEGGDWQVVSHGY